jgi:hypothetical protein
LHAQEESRRRDEEFEEWKERMETKVDDLSMKLGDRSRSRESASRQRKSEFLFIFSTI